MDQICQFYIPLIVISEVSTLLRAFERVGGGATRSVTKGSQATFTLGKEHKQISDPEIQTCSRVFQDGPFLKPVFHD